MTPLELGKRYRTRVACDVVMFSLTTDGKRMCGEVMDWQQVSQGEFTYAIDTGMCIENANYDVTGEVLDKPWARCECGGEKTNTTHSWWCDKYRD